MLNAVMFVMLCLKPASLPCLYQLSPTAEPTAVPMADCAPRNDQMPASSAPALLVSPAADACKSCVLLECAPMAELAESLEEALTPVTVLQDFQASDVRLHRPVTAALV